MLVSGRCQAGCARRPACSRGGASSTMLGVSVMEIDASAAWWVLTNNDIEMMYEVRSTHNAMVPGRLPMRGWGAAVRCLR